VKVTKGSGAARLLLMIIIACSLRTTVQSATPTLHAHIPEGTAFTFVREVKQSGVEQTYHLPRTRAAYPTTAGDMVFAWETKNKTTGPSVYQNAYLLPTDACVVDAANGIALIGGAGCDQLLPARGWTVALPWHDNWVFKYQRNDTMSCQMTRPDAQKTIVPAGSFDTVEIACTRSDSSGSRHSTTYLYARDVGVMVKGVYRKTDSSGNEVWSMTDQLEAFERADQEVSVSSYRTAPHGTWRYRQLRNDTAVACRHNGPAECIAHKLRVENTSGDTLECKSRLTYGGINNENLSSMTALTVVLPKQTRTIVNDLAKPEVSLSSATVECTARAPRPLLNVLEAPQLEKFYPAAALRLREEGPVELSFKLESAQGRASAVSVVGSSLSDRLDEGAIKYVENMTFSTPCPSTTYELRVVFKLVD
jgi:TonB family protein